MSKVENKDRQAAFKQRMRSAGFIQKTVWIKLADLPKLKKLMAKKAPPLSYSSRQG